MARKFAFVLAFMTGALPGGVLALGMGDIQLKSYLNEPLEAKIPVRAASDEEINTLRVILASPADFARAGLDRSSLLRNLRFSVERNEQGEAFISVKTGKDFREPFLNFLLEANWNGGRMLREYTALIDPPSVAMESPTPATQSPAASRSVTAPAPAPSGFAPVTEVAEAAPTGARILGDTFGPTRRNDTMWSIASQVRPDASVTVEQTMLALLRANPNAFVNQNVNELKAGQVLDIPALEDIRSLSAGQARTEFLRQTRVWREGGETSVAEAPVSPGVAGSSGGGRLTLLAPDATEAGEAAGQSAVGSAAGTVGGDSSRALQLAQEAEAAARQENAELRDRLAQMEAQMQDLRRLAELRNDQMAALQRQLAKLGAEAEPLPEAEGGAEDLTASTVAEQSPVQLEVQTEPVSEIVPAEPPQSFGEPVQAADAPAGAPANPYAVEGFRPVNLASLPSQGVSDPFRGFGESATPTQAEPRGMPQGMLDQLMARGEGLVAAAKANPLYLAIAGGVVVLLILLAVVAKRRGRGDDFQESILHTPAAAEQQPETEAAAAVQAPVSEEQRPEEMDSSYMSDFAVSNLESMQSDAGESDPLTEADVFLAYGRFEPAESMMQEAIAKEPERVDLKVKLLEIYAAGKNRDAFEREAQTLHAQMEDHSEAAWQKVAAMGRELAPDNLLFHEDAGENAVADADEASAGAEPLEEFDFNFEAEAPPVDEPAAEQRADSDNLIDFDLGEMAEKERGDAAAVEDNAAEDNALDFNLDEQPAADEVVADAEQAQSGEFSDELAAELGGLSETLEDEQPAFAAGEDVEEFDFDAIQNQLESEPAELEDQTLVETDVAADGDVLAEVDEVGTKLDLARAYIDMGDPDGARSILDEVMEEGSDQQRGEAQELMTQIS